MLVAIIFRVGPDGLNTHVDEYFDRVLDPEEYVTAVKRYDREIGQLDWAAPMDLMCEADMLARTGLTVLEHQRRTVSNFVLLERLWHESDDTVNPESPFMPVLQGGQEPASYLQCWDLYGEAGVDLGNYPLVGVGSVCRQHESEIRAVLKAIRDRDRDAAARVWH